MKKVKELKKGTEKKEIRGEENGAEEIHLWPRTSSDNSPPTPS